MQSYWLLKTEPEDYSWEDMLQEKKVVWGGVKAPAALKQLSRMKTNDLAFIYHTGKERTITGIARVAGMPYQDPSVTDSRRLVIDLVPHESLNRPVTLQQIKQSQLFPHWELVRQPRLSVVPVSQAQCKKILQWAG